MFIHYVKSFKNINNFAIFGKKINMLANKLLKPQ